jgi:hypothetical protein
LVDTKTKIQHKRIEKKNIPSSQSSWPKWPWILVDLSHRRPWCRKLQRECRSQRQRTWQQNSPIHIQCRIARRPYLQIRYIDSEYEWSKKKDLPISTTLTIVQLALAPSCWMSE